MREVGRKINLLGRLSLVRRQLAEMLAQHINGLALGYEDLNDPEQLRSDPLLGVLSGKRDLDEPLAGKGTLNRVAMPVKGYNV